MSTYNISKNQLSFFKHICVSYIHRLRTWGWSHCSDSVNLNISHGVFAVSANYFLLIENSSVGGHALQSLLESWTPSTAGSRYSYLKILIKQNRITKYPRLITGYQWNINESKNSSLNVLFSNIKSRMRISQC